MGLLKLTATYRSTVYYARYVLSDLYGLGSCGSQCIHDHMYMCLWSCAGCVLIMCWSCAGHVLIMCWSCTDHVLAMCWSCAGHVLLAHLRLETEM